MRIARTYEEELELPDRAITYYQLALEEQPHQPQALVALEQLYEKHHRAPELIEVLKLRVELTQEDPEAVRAVLVRLAAVQERDGQSLEAIESLIIDDECYQPRKGFIKLL